MLFSVGTSVSLIMAFCIFLFNRFLIPFIRKLVLSALCVSLRGYVFVSKIMQNTGFEVQKESPALD